MSTLVRLKPKQIVIPGSELEYVGPYGLVTVKQMPLITLGTWYEDLRIVAPNGRRRNLITIPERRVYAPTSRRQPAFARAFPERPETALPFLFRCRSHRQGRCMPTASCPHCGADYEQFTRSGYRRQYCSRLCGRRARLGTEPRTPWQERFWRYVPDPRPDGCWEWTGGRDKKGYGVLMVTPPKASTQAHRASWAIHNHLIPDGMVICHRCDNPPCVNPAHLFLGTQLDNIADMVAKGRQRGGGETIPRETVDAIHALRGAGHLHREIAERLSVSTTYVGAVLAGQLRRHR